MFQSLLVNRNTGEGVTREAMRRARVTEYNATTALNIAVTTRIGGRAEGGIEKPMG